MTTQAKHPNPSDSRQERIAELKRKEQECDKKMKHTVPGTDTYAIAWNRKMAIRFELSRLRNESGDGRTYPFYGYAPGNYSCNCVEKDCTSQIPGMANSRGRFIGDKRAIRCEPCAEKVSAATAVPPEAGSGEAAQVIPCSGCGATKDSKRCIGCLHDFGDPESAWVRTYHQPTPVAQPDAAPRLVQEGHNEPCYYCGEPCNSYAGNPGLWPIPLCHKDDPGVMKWHHTNCVSERLNENVSQPDALRKALERIQTWLRCCDLPKDAVVNFAPFGKYQATPLLLSDLRNAFAALSTPAPAQRETIASYETKQGRTYDDTTVYTWYCMTIKGFNYPGPPREHPHTIDFNEEFHVKPLVEWINANCSTQSDERAGLERAAKWHRRAEDADDLLRKIACHEISLPDTFDLAKNYMAKYPTALRSLAQGDRSDG